MVEEVTIELKNKPNNNNTTYQASTSAGGSNVTITVKRSFYPLDQGSAANFYEYKHEDSAGSPFTLKEVQDDGEHIQGIPKNISNVTSVSAYYWKHENGGPKTTLLVKVVRNNPNETKYYANRKSDTGSNEWIELNGRTQPPFIYGDLERTLDDLVCSNYNAVTIDLTGDTSSAIANRAEPYCCRCHGPITNGDQRKITVTLVTVSCKQHRTSIKCFKQSVKTGGTKLAAIKYYPKKAQDNNDPKNRRRIKLSEHQFPISCAESIYALNCGQDPVLIYVKCGDKGITGWFKKPANGSSSSSSSSTTDTEQWKEATDLNNIKPVDLNNTMDCEKYNKLINALIEFTECQGLKTRLCPQQQPPQPPPPSGLQGSTVEHLVGDKSVSGAEPSHVSGPRESKDEPLSENPGQRQNGAPSPLATNNCGITATNALVTICNAKGKVALLSPPVEGGLPEQSSERLRTEGSDESSSLVEQGTLEGAIAGPPPVPGSGSIESSGGYVDKRGEPAPTTTETEETTKGTSGEHTASQTRSQTVDKGSEVPGTQNVGQSPEGTLQDAGNSSDIAANNPQGVLSEAASTATPSGNETSASEGEKEPLTGGLLEAAAGSVLWTAFGSTSGTLAGAGATFFGGWKLYNRYKGDPWVRQI